MVFSALYRAALEKGVDVLVYQIADTEIERRSIAPLDLSFHKYPYIRLFEGTYSGVPSLRRVFALIFAVAKSKSEFTVIAGYDRAEYWAQAILLFLLGRPFGVFCDSTIFDRPQTRLKGIMKIIFFKMPQVIFCYGERSASYVRHYGARPERIVRRCQAAALPSNFDLSTILAIRRSRREKEQPLSFLYVGRLSSEKGLDTLIHALVVARRQLPFVALRIVGSGPLESALRQLAVDLLLAEAVTFTGPKWEDALYDEYLSAYALVLPSLSEPWGLVVNEALFFGCPVIVSDRCGCVPELVQGNPAALEFRSGDVDDLANAILAANARFSDVDRMTLACQQTIAPFTPQAAATQILDGILSATSRCPRV